MRSIPRRWCGSLGLMAALFLPVGAVVAAPGWSGQITQENGIPLVINPAAAPADDQVVTAIERWRLGGENEDDPLLGLISDVQVDEAGNAYLLDSNLSQIHVVSAAGRHLRVIGREGDGPGEFRRARRLALLPDGTVGVMETMPGQVVVMQRDGTPGPGVHLEGFDTGMRHFESMAADGRGLVIGGVNTSLSESGAVIRRSLSRFDISGRRMAEFVGDEEQQSGGAIRLGNSGNEFTRNWTLCSDGRVAVFGRQHEYRIEFYGPDGGLDRIVTRDYESLRRTDEDMDNARKQTEEMRARFAGMGELEIDPYERDVTNVVSRPDGTSWVANSRGTRSCPPNAVGVFDVLDAEGRLVRTLRIGADFDRDRDTYVVRGDRLFVLKEAQMTSASMSSTGGAGGGQMVMISLGGASADEDEDDARPFEVICYELPE